MNIYSELLRTKQQIMSISNILEQLIRNTQEKCTDEDSIEMRKMRRNVEDLKVKKMALESLLREVSI